MTIRRRAFMAGAAALAAVPAAVIAGENSMYGLIGRMTAKVGKRDALAEILLSGVGGMPGCLSYVVAADPADPEVIWVTEVWTSKDAHAASLGMPSVRDAISKGRPLIAGMATIAETLPLGGPGLAVGK